MPKTAMLASLLLLPLSGPALADLVSTAGGTPLPAGSFFNITGPSFDAARLSGETCISSSFNLKSKFFKTEQINLIITQPDLFAQYI